MTIEQGIIKERQVVSVVKKGGMHDPAPILMWYTDSEVGIMIPLSDFVDLLAEEMGNPATIVTRARLMQRIRVAKDAVVRRMKAETPKLVA